MLERVSANVSFALDNFDHEAARKNGERAMRRLNRMFGAISATNEAIFRAKTEQELYQRVCDAAVHSGKSVATVVLLAEPGSNWLNPVAGTGESLRPDHAGRAFSIDPDNEYGRGVCGRGIPNAAAVHQPRYPQLYAGPALAAGRDGDRRHRLRRCSPDQGWRERRRIAVLCRQIVGRRMRKSSRCWRGSRENVSFALDNFERAERKGEGRPQKERLTRMFAALSATNEAIMRAKSRAELFELVCEAAAKGGRFNSTSILLAQTDSDYPDMVAVAGPTAANMRRVKVSFNAEHPEGHGLCGNAFRSRRACIANDLRADPRGTAFQKFIFSDGARSGAAFPLLVSGQPVGVMFFISAEKDTFTPEFAELLQRLADNVSFAMAVSTAPTRKRGPKSKRSG